MIHILNNIFYYLNVIALLHSQHENKPNFLISQAPQQDHGQEQDTEIVKNPLPSILVKQIPPGPIVPGVVVKFVCAMEDNVRVNVTATNNRSENSNNTGGCMNAEENNGTVYNSNGTLLYQWEMYQYVEDKNGKLNNTNVVTLPGEDSEMEMEFNASVADPKTHCDLVCTIKNNPKQSSASIKLHFLTKDTKKIELPPPSSFKTLAVTSRAVYFSWKVPHPHFDKSTGNEEQFLSNYPEITGYIIEYKKGKGAQDWLHEKVSRYQIKRGDTQAACITNLAPWTTYHFRILSCSRNVSSNPSGTLIVRTGEDFPTAPPAEVKVIALEEKILEVSWHPPPRSTWNGALLGYNIGLKKASASDDEPYNIYIFSPLESIGNDYIHQITVADTSIPYKIVVQAFNNIGVGPFSRPIIQKPKES